MDKEVRKILQIEHAAHLSDGAKQIKLADKTANIRDVAFSAPADWSFERRLKYLAWAEAVVAKLCGSNPKLEKHFYRTLEEARAALAG